MYKITKSVYEIDLLEVRPKDKRGLGIGSDVLRKIILDADGEGINLKLVVAADKGYREKTISLYEKFGFRIVGKAEKNCPLMRRESK